MTYDPRRHHSALHTVGTAFFSSRVRFCTLSMTPKVSLLADQAATCRRFPHSATPTTLLQPCNRSPPLADGRSCTISYERSRRWPSANTRPSTEALHAAASSISIQVLQARELLGLHFASRRNVGVYARGFEKVSKEFGKVIVANRPPKHSACVGFGIPSHLPLGTGPTGGR